MLRAGRIRLLGLPAEAARVRTVSDVMVESLVRWAIWQREKAPGLADHQGRGSTREDGGFVLGGFGGAQAAEEAADAAAF